MTDAVALDERPAPPGFLSGALRVARAAPFQVLRGRRLVALLLLCFVPVFVGVLLHLTGDAGQLGVRRFVDWTSILHMTGIFQVTLLFLGAAAVGDDIDNGTILYLRLRPLSRSSIVVGRYLACVLSATVLLAPAVVAHYLIQIAPRGVDALVESSPILFVLLGIVVLASLAYGALFLLLSLLFRRAVLIGLAFSIGWEVFVSTAVPSNAALLTVAYHLRTILWQTTTEGNELRHMMRPFLESALVPTPMTSVVGLLTASAVLVGMACVAFSRKEFMEKPGDA